MQMGETKARERREQGTVKMDTPLDMEGLGRAGGDTGLTKASGAKQVEGSGLVHVMYCGEFKRYPSGYIYSGIQ